MRVVFSIDLMSTRVRGVIVELASLKGLKLKTALNILFTVLGRVRTRMARELRMASTRRASLKGNQPPLVYWS